MKKVILILPYFGKLPDMFPLFFETVKKNSKIQFLLITDSKEKILESAQNVTLIQEELAGFKSRMEYRLKQKVTLKKPYKLCDYKPLYGYVFEDEIKAFDYWGYCDCDLIFGDLYQFIEPLMEEGYDKIFASGHLTLFRNTEENNALFRAGKEAETLFEKVCGSEQIFWFDEDYKGKENIHDIFLKSGKRVFSEDLSLNFNIDTNVFQRKQYDPQKRTYIDIPYRKEQYYWENGHIYQISKLDGKLVEKEYPYMHFQARYMHGWDKVLSKTCFKIVPNRFFVCKKIPRTLEDWKKERKWYFGGQRLIQLKRRILNKLKKVRRKWVSR